MKGKAVGVFCLFLLLFIWQKEAFAYKGNKCGNIDLSSSCDSSKKDSLTKAYAHYLMGILYDNSNNPKAAIEEYAQAIEYDRNSHYGYLRLAVDYIRIGQYEEAIKQLNFAVQFSPEEIIPRSLLAILYASVNKYDEAIKEYTDMARIAPKDDIWTIGSLADIYILQGKLREAILVYARLPKRKPDMPIASYNMGTLYARLGNAKAAEYYLKRSLVFLNREKFDFKNPQEYLETQEEILDAGLKAEIAHAAYFYLGTICEGQGRRKEAKFYLKKAIGLNPANHQALNFLGYMYAQDAENLDEALDLINAALKYQPDNAAYLDSLGWVYFKKGCLKDAVENLERANRLMPDPEISEHLKEAKEKQALYHKE